MTVEVKQLIVKEKGLKPHEKKVILAIFADYKNKMIFNLPKFGLSPEGSDTIFMKISKVSLQGPRQLFFENFEIFPILCFPISYEYCM